MFSVAPLLFLALSLWLARGLPRPPLLTAVAAFVPAALLFSSRPQPPAQHRDPVRHLRSHPAASTLRHVSTGGAESAEALMWIGGFAAAVAFALLPRRVASVALAGGRGALPRRLLLLRVRLDPRPLASDARTDLDVQPELDRRTNRPWLECRLPLRSDAGSVWRGADHVADRVLEPQCRDGLHARPAGPGPHRQRGDVRRR